jgi:hypothetical protein
MLKTVKRYNEVGQCPRAVIRVNKTHVREPRRFRSRLLQHFISNVQSNGKPRAVLGKFKGLVAITATEVYDGFVFNLREYLGPQQNT